MLSHLDLFMGALTFNGYRLQRYVFSQFVIFLNATNTLLFVTGPKKMSPYDVTIKEFDTIGKKFVSIHKAL